MSNIEKGVYSFKNVFSLKTIKTDDEAIDYLDEKECFKMVWIRKGNGVYNINFEDYEFKENILFFLSPGQTLSVKKESVEEAYVISFVEDFYCLEVHDANVGCNGVLFNNIYENPFISPSKKNTKRLVSILQKIIGEFSKEKAAKHDMLHAYLKQMLVYSLRMKDEYSEINNTIETELFRNFSVLVEQNFKNFHKVNDYAKLLGVSPKSLTKHFNNIGSQTPGDFIRKRIVLEAKRRLVFTKKSVKEIAFDLGYNDPLYFTRVFKKDAKLSPSQFRKNFL